MLTKRSLFRLLATTSLVLTANCAFGQFATTGGTTFSVAIATEAAISVTAATALTTTGTNFNNPYVGSTGFNYKVRTTQTTGAGTIGLRVSIDFSPANGPSVGTPPSAGDALTYTCTTAVSATPCVGTKTASTSATLTNVATFGADAHSVVTGDAGTVTWSLTNDPKYKTGTYTATVTFTIAST